MTGDATIVTGRRVADRYRLATERGDGAWDAVDETLKRNVVVHLLNGLAEAEEKAHFAAEARALAGLTSRNVVATYDTGIDGDGSSYRVEELAAGTPLDPTQVADDRRVSYATQIARALADAHSRNLVHGALSSGFVLVDDEGRVKVRGLRLPREGEDVDALRRTDIYAVSNLVAAIAPSTAHPLREMALGWRGSDPPNSVQAMVSALLTIPDDADTEALIDPTPTPSTGIPSVRRKNSPWVYVGGVLAIAAVAAVITMLLPDSGPSSKLSGPVRALTVVATSFDPEATPPTENEAQAKLAVDGNPATSWATERYRSAHFGNLKDGVGLILKSETPAEFSTLQIRTPSSGWTYRIYVANQAAATLAGWGAAIADGTAVADQTIDLHNAKGSALLVWISDPAGTQMRIGELSVTGRA